MSQRIAILFLNNGKLSPLHHSLLRQRSPQQALWPITAEVVSGGYANSQFRAWWAKAYPTREPLPDDPIARKDGRGTKEYWDVLA